jgi:2-polyprenyl-6-methoxyphenol hydroxylase-like FAD-dependent oxidoreductase
VNLEGVEGTRRLLLSDGFFRDWSEQYKELIRHSTSFRAWPLYTLSKEDLSWSSVPGVTLAGDAAHLSLVSGEGANNALIDSLELASKIAEHGVDDLDRAVQEYETDMLPRGIAQIVKANAMSESSYGEGPEGLLSAFKAF